MPGLQSRGVSVWWCPFMPQFPPLSGEGIQMAARVHSSPNICQRGFLVLTCIPVSPVNCLHPPSATLHYPRCLLSELRGLQELGMSELLRKWQIHCVNH